MFRNSKKKLNSVLTGYKHLTTNLILRMLFETAIHDVDFPGCWGLL